MSGSDGNKYGVFQTYQRYNFESKSQQQGFDSHKLVGCFRPIKDTILKANHNRTFRRFIFTLVFQTYQRYNFESKSQQAHDGYNTAGRCFRPIKDTILKANHNIAFDYCSETRGVSDLSKIQF